MSEPPLRPAATVLVVRPARSGMEVLMVERPMRAEFGGMMVFPGGALEDCDRVTDDRFDDAEFRMAALRETAEEVGFLVTDDGFAPSARLHGTELLESWAASGVRPGLGRLTFVSRWVTPGGRPKRFDTRFYLAPIDGDPEVVLDTDELVGHSWVTPERAIERGRSGVWQLILPTLSHLRWLSRWESVGEAVSAASGADGLTVIEPVMEDGVPVVRYRGT